MSLANPAGLLFATLLLPVIALYILKVRLRRVPVSTLMFWREIFDEKKPRSLWQTLRHWISLLLQLAFLLLLILALADPISRWQSASARRLVVVVDNSASMNARAGDVSRLDRAKAEGERLIEGLRLGDELAIVSAGSPPRVFSGLTDHQRTVREALDAIPATDGPTRVADAVTLARRLLADRGRSRKVVVLSDGCFDGAGPLAKEADIEMIPVAAPAPNVGITRFQARRDLRDPIGYGILAEVRNASAEPASFRLEIDLGDEPIDVIPFTLKPGESNTQVFEKTSAEGGLLRARIDRDDALAADNTAFAILPRRDRQPVTLITPGDLFLEKVFEAMPLVDLTVVRVKEGEAVPAPPPVPRTGPTGPAAVTVYHRVVPPRFPDGPVVAIEPTGPSPLWRVGDPLQNPVVAREDSDSPLMSHIRLVSLSMPEARKLIPTPGSRPEVIAETATGDPLIAAFRREGAARLLALTINLEKSDLPLQTMFPILMANVLGWFGVEGELREAVPTGTVFRLELPAGAAPGPLALRSPDGRETPVERPSGGSNKVVVGPLDRCGVWSISPAGQGAGQESKTRPPLIELSCNLASPRESDLRPAEDLSAPRGGGLGSRFGARPLWYYLLGVAWALVCWEWFLYQRRWID